MKLAGHRLPRRPKSGPPGSLNASSGLRDPQKSVTAFSSTVPASLSRSSPSVAILSLHLATALARQSGSLAFTCTHVAIAPMHFVYVFDRVPRYFAVFLLVSF